MRKFIIFAPPYDENSGGQIWLHKLCHLLNEAGVESYMYPSFENYEISLKNTIVPVLKVIRDGLNLCLPYRTNKRFQTPVFQGSMAEISYSDKYIVVYGEQIMGNPLNAKNIVRWLLHRPGFHTGNIYYNQHEFIIRSGNDPYFSFPNSYTSENILSTFHYPVELYNKEKVSMGRAGVAYCIRKGAGKKIIHDIKNSISIDGKTHKEISKIFKNVEKFISYDPYTAYSRLAAFCGCTSIVIPDEYVKKEEWYPNIKDRYGIAYGFDDQDWAKETQDKVLDYLIEKENTSKIEVNNFIAESNDYFNIN